MSQHRYCQLFCSFLLTFSIGWFNGKAQGTDQVVYQDYTHNQTDFLHTLKTGGGIASFTSMFLLRQSLKNVKESTVVPIKLQKSRKGKMEPVDLVRERKESVLLIWRYLSATTVPEKLGTYATAIVLSEDGVCATNYHVFRNIIETEYKLNPNDSLLFVSTNGGKLYPIKSILTYNKAADLAIFKIDAGKDQLVPFPLGTDLAAGAAVQTLTHPEGYPYFYSKGVVARTITTNPANPFANRAEITADYAKGSSGGAIIDESGNLAGVVSTTYSVYYTERPQMNLQMVVKQIIPVSSLLRLIRN